jgi:hypothetical protein
MLIAGTCEPQPDLNPERYRRHVEEELLRWTPIVRATGLKLD